MSDRFNSFRLSRQDCDLDEFAELVDQPTDPSDYPLAARISQGVPVYDATALALGPQCGDGERAALRDELSAALVTGPGIVVMEGAVSPDAVARVTGAFWRLIEAQRRQGGTAGDHFARPGANDRIWNALEKLAVCDAEAFIDYHRSDAIALACEAWLGPRYQLTEQVNVVNPGGEAQQPHRDYHMGFLTDEEAEEFPRPVHSLSAQLTLQGAIAHCDMAVETGPTMYLPFSHQYELGYLAWRRREFIDYFAQHRVQLPLSAGDAVFFSPAIFHAAGRNRTADVRRIANLLQISSAFGRATESVDRDRLVSAVYPALRARVASGMALAAADNVVAASAEGYAFPTNLDRDPPVDGLAPPSQADIMRRALSEDWPQQRLRVELDALQQRRQSSVVAPTGSAESDPSRRSGGPETSAANSKPDAARGGAARGDAARGGAANADDAFSGDDAVDDGLAGGGACEQPIDLEEMLAEARATIGRLHPLRLFEMLSGSADSDEPTVVVDIRDSLDRARTGTIGGAACIPLTRLQWGCHPGQDYTHPAVTSFQQPIVVVCAEGLSSSLAAASLRRLGFSEVADLEGGIAAWIASGLPLTDSEAHGEAAAPTASSATGLAHPLESQAGHG